MANFTKPHNMTVEGQLHPSTVVGSLAFYVLPDSYAGCTMSKWNSCQKAIEALFVIEYESNLSVKALLRRKRHF